MTTRELQINIHPSDVRHFRVIFENQMRAWGNEVDRVRLTLDLHNSKSGRYRSEAFSKNLQALRIDLADLSAKYKKLIVDEVDYDLKAIHNVAWDLFSHKTMPVKAWDGGPLYSYCYGLWRADADTVIHMDSDMLFGGLSQHWLSEAEAYFDNNSSIAFIAPWAGPPIAGPLRAPNLLNVGDPPVEIAGPGRAVAHSSVSTRIFLTRPKILRERMGKLKWIAPSEGQRLKARLLGNPTELIEFERILTGSLRARELKRVDLLGSGAGMWSLHPPFRNEAFYRDLETIISRIENSELPADQYGQYDIQDSLCDWSDARKYNSRSKRLWRQTARVFSRHFD